MNDKISAKSEQSFEQEPEHIVQIRNLLSFYKINTISYNKGPDEGEEFSALKSSHWACVDGRDTESGILRYPGASAGLLLTLMSAFSKTSQRFVPEKIKEEFEKIMGPISYHSDDHKADEEVAHLSCAGCGHMKLAYKNPEAYDVKRDWIDLIFKGTNLKKDVEQGRATVLTGEHKEWALVVFSSKGKVILPATYYADGTTFFAYHKGVSSKLLELLALKINDALGLFDNSNQLIEEVHKAQDNQVSETVKRLAEEKPVLEI